MLDIKEEFPKWKGKNGEFSFCNFHFILTTSFKCDLLKIESLVQMRHELQDAFFRSMFGGLQMPYLVIEVRREHIVRDTMIQLDRIKSQDLKKQLRIHFVQEEGIDEGGLQKEFFQVIIRKIFHPKYGMFILNEETNCYWFHPSQCSYTVAESSNGNLHERSLHPEENDPILLHEYKLIGKLIGLAIYNNIILDLRFPTVIFKKLLGIPSVFEDLQYVDPLLYRGLTQLLGMEEDNIEEIYQRNFTIEQKSFDKLITCELVPNGENIPLTKQNRNDYVACFVDYYLNRSILHAMNALEEGFREVCVDTALHLFRFDEFETLVCGQAYPDMVALEACTSYDGGYQSETYVIKAFWEIVLHEMTIEEQKLLLFFVTGSDRIPAGGSSKLSFVIIRQGPDSELLPTAHTCYNVLLLPEYSKKEKLRIKLSTALKNAEGFGLI